MNDPFEQGRFANLVAAELQARTSSPSTEYHYEPASFSIVGNGKFYELDSLYRTWQGSPAVQRSLVIREWVDAHLGAPAPIAWSPTPPVAAPVAAPVAPAVAAVPDAAVLGAEPARTAVSGFVADPVVPLLGTAPAPFLEPGPVSSAPSPEPEPAIAAPFAEPEPAIAAPSPEPEPALTEPSAEAEPAPDAAQPEPAVTTTLPPEPVRQVRTIAAVIVPSPTDVLPAHAFADVAPEIAAPPSGAHFATDEASSEPPSAAFNVDAPHAAVAEAPVTEPAVSEPALATRVVPPFEAAPAPDSVLPEPEAAAPRPEPVIKDAVEEPTTAEPVDAPSAGDPAIAVDTTADTTASTAAALADPVAPETLAHPATDTATAPPATTENATTENAPTETAESSAPLAADFDAEHDADDDADDDLAATAAAATVTAEVSSESARAIAPTPPPVAEPAPLTAPLRAPIERIVPVIRSRSLLERVRFALPSEATGGAPFAARLLATHHLVLLAIDNEDGTSDPDRYVTDDDLAAWGTTFNATLSAALARLAEHSSAEALRPLRDGLYRAEFGDGRASSRVLLPALFAELAVKGAVVAAPAGHDTLFIAGADDDTAIAAMINESIAAQHNDANPMPPRLIRFDGANWQSHEPDPATAGGLAATEARQLALSQEYGLQRELMERWFAHVGHRAQVATFKLYKRDGHPLAVAAWPADAEELYLPKVELFQFLGNESQPGFLVHSRNVLEILSDRVADADELYPARWHVTGRLTPLDQARLTAAAYNPG